MCTLYECSLKGFKLSVYNLGGSHDRTKVTVFMIILKINHFVFKKLSDVFFLIKKNWYYFFQINWKETLTLVIYKILKDEGI